LPACYFSSACSPPDGSRGLNRYLNYVEGISNMEQANVYLSGTRPKSGENFWLWLFKLVTGPLILVLIIVHFVVNHYVAEGGLLSYQEIIRYYQIWIVPVMEGIFLFLVVSHSLLGLRSVILDLKPSRGTMRILDGAFILLGIVSFVYGIWLINVIAQLG